MKNRLKELRQLHRWSQAELARKLEVSRQAINGFESGKFDPSLDMAFKIANLLNVAVEDIFIPETKNSMQTLVKKVKNIFGLEFNFERFTKEAINAINYARHEAIQKGENQVKPEHLLLGLLADPTTISARLLQANSVGDNIKTEEYSSDNIQKIELNSETKFILELSLQIVRLQEKRAIGTEHLLWGLIRLLETDTIKLLQKYPINLKVLNEQLIKEL